MLDINVVRGVGIGIGTIQEQGQHADCHAHLAPTGQQPHSVPVTMRKDTMANRVTRTLRGMSKLGVLASAGVLVAFLASCGGGDDNVTTVSVETLSSKPEFVSGGNALVRLRSQAGTLAGAQVRLNGADVTSSFKPDPATGGWLGVVSGMADGSNTLTVSSPSDPSLQGERDPRESSDHRPGVLRPRCRRPTSASSKASASGPRSTRTARRRRRSSTSTART